MSRLDEHTITFGKINSYKDLGLISKNIPFVNPPEAKTDLREVTGMSGKLDYTHVLSNQTFFKNRTGTWEFVTFNDYMKTWKKAYSTLHGKTFDLWLDDDAENLYHGRITVEEPSSNGIKMTIKVDYDLLVEKSINPDAPSVAPYIQSRTARKAPQRAKRNSVRKSQAKAEPPLYGLVPYLNDGQYTIENPNTSQFDWKWDDLFDNVIYYGNFHVDGQKWRNFINPGNVDVIPTFNLTAPMKIEFMGMTFDMIKGITTDYELKLKPGDNILHFTGTGDVNVDYRIGVTI